MNSDNEIRKQFKSKFDDFKVLIPEDGWSQLDESLNSIEVVKNNKVRTIWRIVGSVAAIAVLIFGSILLLNLPFNQVDTLVSDADDKYTQFKQNKSETVIETFSSDLIKQDKKEELIAKR